MIRRMMWKGFYFFFQVFFEVEIHGHLKKYSIHCFSSEIYLSIKLFKDIKKKESNSIWSHFNEKPRMFFWGIWGVFEIPDFLKKIFTDFFILIHSTFMGVNGLNFGNILMALGWIDGEVKKWNIQKSSRPSQDLQIHIHHNWIHKHSGD